MMNGIEQGIQYINPHHQVEFDHPELDLEQELDVIEENDEKAEETNESNDKRIKRTVRKVTKKRRPSDKESIKNVHDDLNPEKLLRQKADKRKDVYLKKINTKLNLQLNKELKDFILSQKKSELKSKILSDTIKISSNYQQDYTKETILKTQKKQTEKPVVNLQQQQLVPTIEHGIKQYISSYSDVLLKETTEKKTKLKKAEDNLLKQGITTKQIREIKNNAGKFIHTDLKKQLKKQYLRIALSFNNKMQAGLFYNYSSYYSLLETAKQANVFNADNKRIKEFQNQIKSEINVALTNELDKELVQAKLETSDITKLVDTFEKYNGIAGLSKFNINDYVKRLNKKMDDEGLMPFLNPNKIGPLDTDTDQSSSQNNSNQKKDDDVLTEKDILEKDLRNLLIQSHFKKSFINQFKNKRDIEKCKKTISEKNHTNIDIKQIEDQAKKIATLRLFLTLRSLLETRAALTSLKTKEYKAVRKKIKETLKNLKAVGKFISSAELQELKHQCNKAMFSVIKEDYIKQKIHLETDPKNIYLEHHVNQLKENLDRLKEESSIMEKTDPKLIEDLHFLKDVNIVEAA